MAGIIGWVRVLGARLKIPRVEVRRVR